MRLSLQTMRFIYLEQMGMFSQCVRACKGCEKYVLLSLYPRILIIAQASNCPPFPSFPPHLPSITFPLSIRLPSSQMCNIFECIRDMSAYQQLTDNLVERIRAATPVALGIF